MYIENYVPLEMIPANECAGLQVIERSARYVKRHPATRLAPSRSDVARGPTAAGARAGPGAGKPAMPERDGGSGVAVSKQKNSAPSCPSLSSPFFFTLILLTP